MINSSLPKVGYLTAMDKYIITAYTYGLTLALTYRSLLASYVVSSLIESVLVYSVQEKHSKDGAATFDYWMLVVFPTTFILFNLIWYFHYMRLYVCLLAHGLPCSPSTGAPASTHTRPDALSARFRRA